jgi:pimeloyl-ACP methyl ester carboxylesterase
MKTELGYARAADGFEVAFETTGSGPGLVLVHGLGDARQSFAPLVERWRAAFTCVALDLRGHGDTRGGSDYGPFSAERDIIGVVETLGLERPLLVGHSLGGFAVTTAAARIPVRGVVNVDQPLDLRALSALVHSLGRALWEEPAGEIVLGVLANLGFGEMPVSAVERLRASAGRLTGEVLRGVWLPLLGDEEKLRDAVRRAVEGVRAPYLSLHGSGVPQGYAAVLADLIPGAKLEDWAGHGHFPHLSAPERFVERVLHFAASCP